MSVTEGLCGTILVCTSLPLSLRTGRARASGVRSRGSVTAKHVGKATGKVELGEVGGTESRARFCPRLIVWPL